MDHNDLPAELRDVARRLQDDRPELSGPELEAIERRVITTAARGSRSPFTRKGPLMKSRLAVTTALVLGLLMSGTGATLAVSGLAGSGSAGTAQYSDSLPQGQTLGEQEANPETVGSDVQPTRQAVATADDSGSLPFTGFLAIPVLVGGVALLGTGVVLRRRTGADRHDA